MEFANLVFIEIVSYDCIWEYSDDDMDFVQYRIIRRDGEIRWVDDCGHLEKSEWGEENRLFYVFIKDITDTITAVQKEKLLNANRFFLDQRRQNSAPEEELAETI